MALELLLGFCAELLAAFWSVVELELIALSGGGVVVLGCAVWSVAVPVVFDVDGEVWDPIALCELLLEVAAFDWSGGGVVVLGWAV